MGEFMEIIEQFCKGKIDDEKNEDGIFSNEYFIVVIDGITSKGKKLYQGKKTGRYARDLLLECLKHIPRDVTKEEMITMLNQSLKQEECLSIQDMPSAGVIIYSDYYKAIWNFGDCQCMINGRYYDNSKRLDKIAAEARALFNELLIAEGMDEKDLLKRDLGKEFIWPLLEKQPILEGCTTSPYGYQVLNGREIHLDKISELPVSKGDEIIFASDGYPFLKSTLQESEKALENLIQTDPLCIRDYKNTKGLEEGQSSYDDRSYIRFLVS